MGIEYRHYNISKRVSEDANALTTFGGKVDHQAVMMLRGVKTIEIFK